MCVCQSRIGVSGAEMQGPASKSAKQGSQQWIGDTFDAVRKINQTDLEQKINMGWAPWLSWLWPHERANQR